MHCYNVGAFFEETRKPRICHVGFMDIRFNGGRNAGERSNRRIMGTESETATSGGIWGGRETMQATFPWKKSL